MRIEVKQHHIDAGVPGDTQKCAVANALREMGFKKVSVAPVGNGPYAHVRAFVNDREMYGNVEAFDWIRNFDTNKAEAKPTTIELQTSPYYAMSSDLPPFQMMQKHSHMSFKPMMMSDGEMPTAQITTDYTKWMPKHDMLAKYKAYDYKIRPSKMMLGSF